MGSFFAQSFFAFALPTTVRSRPIEGPFVGCSRRSLASGGPSASWRLTTATHGPVLANWFLCALRRFTLCTARDSLQRRKQRSLRFLRGRCICIGAWRILRDRPSYRTTAWSTTSSIPTGAAARQLVCAWVMPPRKPLSMDFSLLARMMSWNPSSGREFVPGASSVDAYDAGGSFSSPSTSRVMLVQRARSSAIVSGCGRPS